MTALVTIRAGDLRSIRDALWIDYITRHSTDADPAPFNAYPHVRAIDEALSRTVSPSKLAQTLGSPNSFQRTPA